MAQNKLLNGVRDTEIVSIDGQQGVPRRAAPKRPTKSERRLKVRRELTELRIEWLKKQKQNL